ncbi:BsaWI family type II restriction enzyme [Helicobacter bizzozeronii]|uniref:BsaWI family type II restriction enzyme n=1 Tax=Helicobacter bizzozeronii TaxID=56877 RepID=UPI000CF146CF|nr:BsaWI family type II restriction enzyme [Helicobacter bizzozeronii]
MLNKDEIKTLKAIESKYYLQPVLELINKDIDSTGITWFGIFDRLYHYMIESRSAVNALIEKRVSNKEIKDANQARKSIAGNAFSSLIIYTFLKNKIEGAIAPHIFISAKLTQVPHYQKLFQIQIGDETQKPDVDLVVYSLDSVGKLKNCLILSLKTSLRERAAQTYKWKLLMEIANSDSKLKEKYDIVYKPPIMPLVCFATINFYNEIDRPQQRGMFKFFDCAFIGKPIYDRDFIKPLSYLMTYIKEQL